MVQLDAACARVNPGLVIAALILAVLDVAAAEQRWTLTYPHVSAKTVEVVTESERCAPEIPPELRDMAGRD
jgi:hypothetical protein